MFHLYFFRHVFPLPSRSRNCIGRGNRRLYLLFLLCSSLFLVCFSILSLSTHSQGICLESAGPESKTFFQSVRHISFLFICHSFSPLFFPNFPFLILNFYPQIYYFFSTEYCAAFSLPASFLLTWINLRLACHFVTSLGLQLMLIVRQSTVHYVRPIIMCVKSVIIMFVLCTNYVRIEY